MDSRKIYCNSEIGQLKKVIVHRPDEGINRISPKDAEELLFDDIVFLPQMQLEHDIFTKVLQIFVGKENVLFVNDLLIQSLDSDQIKKNELIKMILDYEELPPAYGENFKDWSNERLAQVLITGYDEMSEQYYFEPIPNFIFTRDIAVTIKDHVIITKAAKEARFRENFLARYIFWAHPLFSELQNEGRVINLNRVENFPPSKKGEWVNLEGGDAMMFTDDYFLIGNSERTTEHAIQSLTKVIFEKNLVNHVVQIKIPPERSFMHIDTIFTQINTNDIVAFKPLIYEGLFTSVEVIAKDGNHRVYSSLKDFILKEINPNMRFIFAGNGESPYQEREQWTDGCNLVALKPGVAITYDRNPYTEIALKNAGYSILPAAELISKFENGELHPDQIENTIITLPSNELSRARGGSHCMTCPIERSR